MARVVAFEGERSRFEAVRTRVTGVFDRRGRWALDQAKSAAAWVAHRCRLLIGVARESER